MLAEGVSAALRTVRVSSDLTNAAVGERELAAGEHTELRGLLAGEIYQMWHVGTRLVDGDPPRSMRDPETEELLAQAMPFRRTVRELRVVRESTAAEDLIVSLGGLRVRVPTDRVHRGSTARTGERVRVELDAARPAVSPGFFLVDRSASRGPIPTGPTLRVYVHLDDVDTAVAMWGAVLAALEDLAVEYRAKISSVRRMFPRRDGLVVYLGPRSWHAVEEIMRAVVAVGDRSRSSTSPFSRLVGPGVALAWEPYDTRPGMRGMSFGEHRAAAVVEGVLAHASSPEGRYSDRDTAVAAALREAGIDPEDPARNLGSPVAGDDLSSTGTASGTVVTGYSEHARV